MLSKSLPEPSLQSVQRVNACNPKTVFSSNLPLEHSCITAAWALLDHPYSLTSQHQRVKKLHISSWKIHTHTHRAQRSGSRPVFFISLLHFCRGKNGSAHCSLALRGNTDPACCFLSPPYTAVPCVRILYVDILCTFAWDMCVCVFVGGVACFYSLIGANWLNKDRNIWFVDLVRKCNW